MAEELSLEEYQKEVYNERLANLVFTAEYKDLEIVKSSELNVVNKGINLHFLRHGLFDKNTDIETLDVSVAVKDFSEKPKTNTIDTNLEEVKIDYYSEYPRIKNHYFAETAIRKGYIYILFENKENLWLEYQTTDGGGLKPIIWKKGSDEEGNQGYYDVREAENEIIDTGITVERCDIIWVAFSTVQWSIKYHEKMRTDFDAKSLRMKRFECTGFQPDETIKFAKPYDEVFGIFEPEDYTEAYFLKDRLDRVKLEHTEENFKEDMFLILDDPLGWAEDISANLKLEYTKLDALIESIHTGQNENEILERLKLGELRTAPLSDYEKQVMALTSTATTTYHLIYNDPKMQEDFGDTTDKDKVINILGVKQRKKQRDLILELRDDFGNCLESSKYQASLKDYLLNTPIGIFDGNEIIGEHLSLLAMHPMDKDRIFNLKREYHEKRDSWSPLFKKILCKEDDLVFPLLLEANVEFVDVSDDAYDFKDEHKVGRRFIKSLKSILDAFVKYSTAEITYATTLSYLKSFTIAGETVFQFKKVELFSKLDVKGYGLNLKNAELKTRKGSVFAQITTTQPQEYIDEVIKNKKLEVEVEKLPSKMSKRAKHLLGHPKFKVFILGLELLNTTVKLKAISKDFDPKNTISTFGAISHLASAARSYQEAVLSAKGANLASGVQKTLSNAGKISGFIGSGVTVVMCAWDGVESIRSRDYDSGIVWFATSAMAAALLVNGVLVFLAELNVISLVGGGLSGGWLIALNILFFGGVVLAIYLSDTPLEAYLKNSILSSYKKVKASLNIRPFKYISLVNSQKSILIPSKFEKRRDFVFANQEFDDLLISYKVREQVLDFGEDPNKPDEDSDWMDSVRDVMQMSAGMKYAHIKKLKISVLLRRFFYNQSELHFELYLFPSSGKMRKLNIPKIIETNCVELNHQNGVDQIDLIYDIPTEVSNLVGRGAEFIFLSRSVINEKLNHHWPMQNGNERFHAYRFSGVHFLQVFESKDLDEQLLFGNYVRIGTSEEVLNEEFWNSHI